MKPSDYKHIYSWHKLTGSYPLYIRNLQIQAMKDAAPLDAIYYSEDDGWVRASELTSDHPYHARHKELTK